MYSPAAIENAPASSPATPESRITPGSGPAPATPRIKLALDTRPSFTPNTAARRLPPPAQPAMPALQPGRWVVVRMPGRPRQVQRQPAHLHGREHRAHRPRPEPAGERDDDPRAHVRTVGGRRLGACSLRRVGPDPRLVARLARKLAEQSSLRSVAFDLREQRVQIGRALLFLPVFQFVHSLETFAPERRFAAQRTADSSEVPESLRQVSRTDATKTATVRYLQQRQRRWFIGLSLLSCSALCASLRFA